MVYADYEYYTKKYLGTSISEKDFPRLALRASSFLDYYTRGLAQKVQSAAEKLWKYGEAIYGVSKYNSEPTQLTALKMACCAIAEQYQTIETAQALAQKSLTYSMTSDGAEMSSESVGSWSRSYRSGGESAASASASIENYKQTLAEIAKQYLTGTGLLYRGGRYCVQSCC